MISGVPRLLRGGATEKRALRLPVLIAAATGVALVAVAARLVPVLRGGGLYGLGNYDDGVYFAAAVGLWHGRLPYRDFLLLHPPGIAVLLTPFAALAEVVGEPDAMAAARLGWMSLGALNAVLVVVVLHPVHRTAALLSGLLYAVFFPAVYSEHSTLLEAPGTTALLGALVLTRILADGREIGSVGYLAAGFLLGLAPAVKIWGIVAVVVVVAALAVRRGRRPAILVAAGAAATTIAICLPFFLQAPLTMWQMVVVDQVGRHRREPELLRRLDDILGLTMWTGPPRFHVGTLGMLLLVTLALVVCLATAGVRILGVLLVTHGLVLAATPMWFLHNATLTAAPVVLVLGAALGVLLNRLPARLTRFPVLQAIAVLVLLCLAAPLVTLRLNRGFAAAEAAALVAPTTGCVVTDFPMTLIQMDLLERKLGPGCRYVVDLGGTSYHLPAGPDEDQPRARNQRWQAYALDYLRSGEVAVLGRFRDGAGFSKETAEVVDSWPRLGQVGDVVIREPRP